MLGSLSTSTEIDHAGDNGELTAAEKALIREISSGNNFLHLLTQKAEAEPIVHFLFNQRYLGVARYLSSKFERQFEINETNVNGEGLIHFIAQFQEFNWLLWLSTVSAANLFLRTKTKQNVFHYSAHITDTCFLNHLFSLTTEIEHLFCVNSLAQSPLDLAIEYDNEVFFGHYLLKYRKESLNYVNSTNQNILHLMAKHNSLKCFAMLKSLISQGELWDLEFALDKMGNTPRAIAEEIAKTNADHAILHAIMGYVDIRMKSLQWEVALATVAERLSQISVATNPADPSQPYGNLLTTLPHLKPLFEHAYQDYKARQAAHDYQLLCCDQMEEENPNFRYSIS